VCIASGVGATVETENPFSEDPHRFLAVMERGSAEVPQDLARRIGSIGGDQIVVNGVSLPLDTAVDLWTTALPEALAG
jgi:hypothetical protein